MSRGHGRLNVDSRFVQSPLTETRRGSVGNANDYLPRSQNGKDPRMPDLTSEPVETDWFRFGLAVAVAHLVFLVILVVLLRIDVALALVVAVLASIVGGIAITVIALRRR
jgi:hypothetical protein